MNKQQVVWVVILYIILTILFLVLKAVRNIIRERRRAKHGNWQPGELQERAEWRKHVAQQIAERQAWQEKVYEIHLCLEKEEENRVQLAQARTQAKSPEYVVAEAVYLYTCLVEWYSQGYKMFMGKPSDTKRMRITRFRYDPLDRVQKKVES